MSHPLGLAGWATVANHVVAAAELMTLAMTSAVIAGGGGMVRSGWTGSVPSRRKMAWKWIRPRRWNSATLANESRTRAPCGLASLSRRRRMPMTVRRHNSGAWAFHTTEAL